MWVSSVLSPIACGLITTINLDEHIGKSIGLLAFVGAAAGLGISGPQIALQAVLPVDDVSSGADESPLGRSANPLLDEGILLVDSERSLLMELRKRCGLKH